MRICSKVYYGIGRDAVYVDRFDKIANKCTKSVTPIGVNGSTRTDDRPESRRLSTPLPWRAGTPSPARLLVAVWPSVGVLFISRRRDDAGGAGRTRLWRRCGTGGSYGCAEIQGAAVMGTVGCSDLSESTGSSVLPWAVEHSRGEPV